MAIITTGASTSPCGEHLRPQSLLGLGDNIKLFISNLLEDMACQLGLRLFIMATNKIYTISKYDAGPTSASRFYPGVDGNGRQVLFVAMNSLMYAYWFDKNGIYICRESRDASLGFPSLSLGQHTHEGLGILVEWMNELRITPRSIKVQQFTSFDSPRLKISDYPDSFEDGDMGTEQDKERLLQWWHDIGAFVLSWNGKDYWLDRNGEICV